MFNDLGVYGVPKAVRNRQRWDSVAALKRMEAYTRNNSSFNLKSNNFYQQFLINSIQIIFLFETQTTSILYEFFLLLMLKII